jgi:hypothetical protein
MATHKSTQITALFEIRRRWNRAKIGIRAKSSLGSPIQIGYLQREMPQISSHPPCTSLSTGMLEYATPFDPDTDSVRTSFRANDRCAAGAPSHFSPLTVDFPVNSESLSVVGSAIGVHADLAPLVLDS